MDNKIKETYNELISSLKDYGIYAIRKSKKIMHIFYLYDRRVEYEVRYFNFKERRTTTVVHLYNVDKKTLCEIIENNFIGGN